uniref:Uncharacterized protein n=1 Tax=Macrostomum lignano TaxID=282301 RepID=A0A1I8FEP6_9PLAT
MLRPNSCACFSATSDARLLCPADAEGFNEQEADQPAIAARHPPQQPPPPRRRKFWRQTRCENHATAAASEVLHDEVHRPTGSAHTRQHSCRTRAPDLLANQLTCCFTTWCCQLWLQMFAKLTRNYLEAIKWRSCSCRSSSGGFYWSMAGINTSMLKAIYNRSRRQDQFRRMNASLQFDVASPVVDGLPHTSCQLPLAPASSSRVPPTASSTVTFGEAPSGSVTEKVTPTLLLPFTRSWLGRAHELRWSVGQDDPGSSLVSNGDGRVLSGCDRAKLSGRRTCSEVGGAGAAAHLPGRSGSRVYREVLLDWVTYSFVQEIQEPSHEGRDFSAI